MATKDSPFLALTLDDRLGCIRHFPPYIVEAFLLKECVQKKISAVARLCSLLRVCQGARLVGEPIRGPNLREGIAIAGRLLCACIVCVIVEILAVGRGA